MHAKIAHNQSVTRVLQYHELKVRKGIGECIAGENFIKDVGDLAFEEKWYHFHRLTTLNENVRKNVLHVFMQFSKADVIDNATMGQVAGEYLDEMGFGQQPYLVYRHYDSYAEHAHLVSPNVDPEGNKIRISLAQLYESRQLTHRLEEKYGLDRGQAVRPEMPVETIRYGEMPLLPTMSKVLERVIPEYQYTSLDELNAVLSLYNMRASRGPEGSACYEQGGLVYKPLRADGRDADAAIAARVFEVPATLRELEGRFEENLVKREGLRDRLTTAVDWCLAGSSLSLDAFKESMEYEGVGVVYRQDKDQSPQVWFVDHGSRAVFAGSALGENYSAEGLGRRCIPEEQYHQQQEQVEKEAERQHLRLHL